MPLDVKEPNLLKSDLTGLNRRTLGPAEAPAHGRGNDSVGERRREPRYPCHDAAEVRRLDGDRKCFPATVLDVSRSGLGLGLSVRLTPGSPVEIVLPKQVVVFGEVRHCRPIADAFYAGILVEDVFYAGDRASGHFHDDQMTLYLAGKGLSLREVVAMGQHLRKCRLCNARLQETKLLQGRLAERVTQR